MTSASLIFDLDGTLVDSETLNCQAFLDLIPELTYSASVLGERYRGWKLANILADIERQIGYELGEKFESQYRKRVRELYEIDLKAVPHVNEVLALLMHQKSVASSAPRNKIEHALTLTGLTSHFGDHIFSSYDIGAWKPDPALFLYAAKQMGAAPSTCIVIEDSLVGVEAAHRAGMRVLVYGAADRVPRVTQGRTFSSMTELPRLIQDLENAI